MDIGLILLQVLALFMALTFHEFAHGWVARRLGDHTAESQGRLTLNPKDHIDPFGTVLLPAMLILMKSPVVFGWAKPVPIDPRNFRDPRRGMMWSALGGPMINLFLAAVLALVFKAMLVAGLYVQGLLMFLIIARDPVRFRWAMPVGILEKLGFGLPVLWLFSQGRLAQSMMIFGAIDLLWALLFAAAFMRTPQQVAG